MPDTAAMLNRILRDHRQHVSENFPAPGICLSRCADSQPRWPCGAYRAATAAKAVLKLHGPGCVTILGALCKRHENHRHFSITATEADDVRACRDCEATVYVSCAGCGTGVSVDACPTRAAITTALAGEEAGDEH